MTPVLEFERVSKRYRRWPREAAVRALDEFSLAIEPGEIFGFLGPNGAGKSTAIHIALGLMRPTSGRGTLLGRPFGHAPTRCRIGFLAENVALYHRPAASLVRFYGGLNGIAEPLLTARTRALLADLDLAGDAARKVSKFSRGMLQRVGLAQALVNDPELLILDEPTSALDPVGRVRVRELLVAARNAGKTIFLSSHLLSEVELICDRVAILRQGRIAHLGATSDLLENSQRFEVVARGVKHPLAGSLSSSDGMQHYLVSAVAQRALLEAIWAAGGEVLRVQPERRSLEDIFLELTALPPQEPRA